MAHPTTDIVCDDSEEEYEDEDSEEEEEYTGDPGLRYYHTTLRSLTRSLAAGDLTPGCVRWAALELFRDIQKEPESLQRDELVESSLALAREAQIGVNFSGGRLGL